MKLQLNDNIKNLNDQPMVDENQQPLTINRVIANALATGKDNPVKRMALALKFWSGEPLEIDEADFKLVRDTIEQAGMSAIISAPVLNALDTAKGGSV